MGINKKRVMIVLCAIIGISLLFILFALALEYIEPIKKTTFTSYILIFNMPLLLLLFTMFLLSHEKKFWLRRRHSKKRGEGATTPLTQDYVGKKAIFSGLNNEFRGVIVEIEGDFIKIKDRDMRPIFHILKTDMITSIKIEGDSK